MLEKIQINNFRNLNNCFLEFNPNINYLSGNNAQGKTAFIESLYFLGHNKSFKEKNIKNIIQKNKDFFSIQAIFNQEKIQIKRKSNYNNILLNQNKILNSSVLSKKIPIQIISPDKGFIVGGENKNKRYYLDWAMFHVKPEFLSIYKKSKKIQKNINTLIIEKQHNQLDIWFKEFANTNYLLNKIRNDYLNDLKKTDIKNLFDSFNLDINNFDYMFDNGLPKKTKKADDIYIFLQENKNKIIKNKYLKYGSHLATIDFFLQKTPEKQLSRGQQKTLSIVFWIVQILHLLENNIKPIILIDDITSELDDLKVQNIINILKQIPTQSFITSIKPISDNFYYIKNGEIVYNK